ncbi:uncharacterized protein J7T55_000304 [Diaporthe amygdali]|uniref:uncharacterized protein n=1 Tax=Phomopsis amygdali TaxID=1214568 RepID=UPI0022FE456B|nr:uncharacterized protein J7T55_000304 [Diaporthe amygdali]KAJ0109379.1 uncharacterized protein J7T55_000304 [Diaporthe amygdali]
MLSANDMAEMYGYLDKGEFRLIILRPERKDDPEGIIRCDMLNCPLGNSRPYVALSYAWGDVSDTRKIFVGSANRTISVSASLESALRALRDPRKSITVWADAISINQQDQSEKADQVRLMTRIYQKAESVAIWLGPRSEDSDLGMELIEQVSNGAEMPREITRRTPAPFSEQNFAAVVALFDREYWHRLWVVQEVFNARAINVHCGPAILPWSAFQTASDVFQDHRDVLERSFHPGYSNRFYQARSGSYPQVLVHEGPGSLARVGSRANFMDGDDVPDRLVFQNLLEVMQACRRKLSSDPKDKVFGLLGVLSEKIRSEIKVDYGVPVKDIYVNIFRTVVEKTGSLDILCESIHFPDYANNNNLPSWVPDWSHISKVSPIATTHTFSASRKAEVVVDFTERNKLRISAIPLGSIKEHGVAVGTRCTLYDYLTAFLQWRACLLQAFDGHPDKFLQSLEQRFCLALSLSHIPEDYETPEEWMDICYHVFALTLRDRLPKFKIDHELEQYIGRDPQMDYNKRRLFLQENVASNMMGRCFCITDEDRVGLGTGFMIRGDHVVVPLGCSTPVVLRPEGDGYRFVGDVYINGYMFGRAVEECNKGFMDRQVKTYIIH